MWIKMWEKPQATLSARENYPVVLHTKYLACFNQLLNKAELEMVALCTVKSKNNL